MRGARQHTKLRRGEGGGCAIEDAIGRFRRVCFMSRLRRACVLFLLLLLSPRRRGRSGNDTAGWWTGQSGSVQTVAGGSCAFAIDDDGRLRRLAGRDGFGNPRYSILGRIHFGVLVAAERASGCRFLGVAEGCPSICTTPGRASTSRRTCSF